jgi:hypothetical protein
MSTPEKYLVLPWGRVRVPPEDENEYVAIRVSVLDRWLKHMDRLGRRYDNISAAYWGLFGASIAMAAAVPPLLSTKLPSWIAPTYIVSAVSFFVLAVILVLVSVSLRSDQSATASEIAQEMHAIRTTLGREE